MKKQNKYNLRREDFATDQDYASAWQRAFRATDAGKAHVRRMNLRQKGLTPERYDALLAYQRGACAVCGTTDPKSNQHGKQAFCVDHDRTCCPTDKSCGKCVRGLLCHNCNRAEGLLRGNAIALATYLTQHSQRKSQPVYLSGPMSNMPGLNHAAFNSTAARLRDLGYVVTNPAEVKLPEGSGWSNYMRVDISLLMACEQVATLPGWEKSKGANLEVFIARELRMPVWNAEDLVEPLERAA